MIEIVPYNAEQNINCAGLGNLRGEGNCGIVVTNSHVEVNPAVCTVTQTSAGVISLHLTGATDYTAVEPISYLYDSFQRNEYSIDYPWRFESVPYDANAYVGVDRNAAESPVDQYGGSMVASNEPEWHGVARFVSGDRCFVIYRRPAKPNSAGNYDIMGRGRRRPACSLEAAQIIRQTIAIGSPVPRPSHTMSIFTNGSAALTQSWRRQHRRQR